MDAAPVPVDGPAIPKGIAAAHTFNQNIAAAFHKSFTKYALKSICPGGHNVTASKAQRVAVFVKHVEQAPPAASEVEARQLLEAVLNAVEDELTSIPYAPDLWQTDGRMYAPRDDSARTVPGRPDVTRYRNRNHNTWIGQNGAIRICRSDGTCLLDKPGKDGRTVEI